MKRVLITGENSYIGTSFAEYAGKQPTEIKIDKLSVRDDRWKSVDFSSYDAILHVAGIAHVKTTKSNQDLYYKVNRDLAVDIAKKAKAEGVGQFVFLSSQSVYVFKNCADVIDKGSPKNPDTHYGKSKLEAENILKSLQSDKFILSILRPPMVYGKNSPGNFKSLVKLARLTPIFPNIENQRSMIYIDTLSEFIQQIVATSMGGEFHPQNDSYVCTSDMVKKIATSLGKSIVTTRVFNPLIRLLAKKVGLIDKIFGNLVYSQEMSAALGVNYQKVGLAESIEGSL